MTETTFNNQTHNALFAEGTSLTNGDIFAEKWSDLIISALRDIGVFDNVVIAATPPGDRTRLWLDTTPHPDLPSVLRINDPGTLQWNPITFNDLFENADSVNRFANIAELLGSTTVFSLGTILYAEREGMSYRVADTPATDQHETTAGGVKLYEAGFNFSTLDARTATDAAGYRQGLVVFLRGEPVLVDSTATGSDSVGNPFGVNGLRSLLEDGALLSANNLSDLDNAATARTNLGLGALATQNTVNLNNQVSGLLSGTSVLSATTTSRGVVEAATTAEGDDGTSAFVFPPVSVVRSMITTHGNDGDLLAANNLSDLANAGTARTNLGLGGLATEDDVDLASEVTGTLPGTSVSQATDAARGTVELATTGEGNTGTSTTLVPPVDVVVSMIATHAPGGGGGGDLLAANNLSDLDNLATARTNLGLGDLATQDDVDLSTDTTGTLAGNNVSQATDAARGTVELATTAEGNTGTSTTLVPPVDVVVSMINTHGGGGGGTAALEAIGAPVDVSGASNVDFTGFSNTYTDYMFTARNVLMSATSADIRILTSSNSGTSYDTASGDYSNQIPSSLTVSIVAAAGVGNVNAGAGFDLKVFDPLAANRTAMVATGTNQASAGNIVSVFNRSVRNSTSPVNAMRFTASTGTFLSGEIQMYGIRS